MGLYLHGEGAMGPRGIMTMNEAHVCIATEAGDITSDMRGIMDTLCGRQIRSACAHLHVARSGMLKVNLSERAGGAVSFH